jgi:hypothetical protein
MRAHRPPGGVELPPIRPSEYTPGRRREKVEVEIGGVVRPTYRERVRPLPANL